MFGFTPLRRNFDAAVRDLRSPKPEVRASAAHDLGLVGDADARRASDALAPLVDDTWSDVRGAALSALGTLRARHLADRIASRAEDGDTRVRQLAVVALAEVGGERALELLKSLRESAFADVRYQAMLGVLSLDAAEGYAVALENLASDDPWIASEAAEQLGRLFAVDAAQRTPNTLDDAARARAMDALRQRIGATPERVAVAAAVALLRAGAHDVVARVGAFVRDARGVEGDDREALVVEALELLGGVTGPSTEHAREALAAVAWRVLPTEARGVARASLARLGDTRAAEEIVVLLRSLLPARREAGVRLARAARLKESEGALITLLEDGGADAAMVIDALGEVGGARARNTLGKVARTHDRAEIRDAARKALSRIEENRT